MLHLVTLGDAAVETGVARIDAATPHPLLAALYVARARDRRVPRATLCDLLWPGEGREAQRPRLRALLHRLRRLGVPIESSTQDVALEAVETTADYERPPAPDALLDDPALAPRIAVILPLDAAGLPAFADWLDEQRAEIARPVTRALVAALAVGRARSDWTAVERCAEACRRVDPLNEEAHLALAEALCMTASKERALVVLDDYEAQLGERRQLRLPARMLRERIEHAADRPLVGGSAVDAPFVGRGDVRSQLLEAFVETRRGAGGGRVVWGPPGIGKSRLLAETARDLALRGATTVTVRCQPGDSLRPLSALFDLVPRLLDLPGAIGCERSTLDELRTLPSSSEAVVLSAAEGAARRARLELALLDLLDAVSGEAPLVVIVDDVQWMDAGMEQLWRGVLPWSATHPVLWLFGCRAERRDELRQLPLGGDATAIPLASLDARAAAELVDFLMASVPDSAPDARGAVVALGGGSPLLLHELVRRYAETRRIDTLPQSIAPVIAGRLDRLDRAALRVLQGSALLGPYASIERVGAIVGLPRSELLDAVAVLLDAGILAGDARDVLHGHALWCDAALARLQPALHRALHRHSGELLERELEREASPGLLWECARHWREAGDAPRALAAAARGAEQLVAHGFFRDAAGVYARAAAESRDPARRVTLLRRRVELLRLAGCWVEHMAAVDDHERLAAELDPAYDPHNDFEIARVDSLVLSASDYVAGGERLLQCARAPEASVLHRLRAAKGAVFQGDRSGRESIMAEAASIAASLPAATIAERREARLALVRYHTAVGDLGIAADLGEEWIAEERERALRGEGEDDLLQAMRISWDAFLNADRLDRAWSVAREMVAMSRRDPRALQTRSAIDTMLVLCLEFDRLDEARRWIETMSALPEVTASGTSLLGRIFVPMYRLELAVRRGDGEEAVRVAPPLDECLALPVGTRFHGRFVGAHLGARLLVQDDDAARALARRMAGYFTRPDRWMDLPATMYTRALCRYEGESAAAAFAVRYLGELRRERYRPPAELLRYRNPRPADREERERARA